MCLCTDRKKPFIAKKAIKCYKQVYITEYKGELCIITPYMRKDIPASHILYKTNKMVMSSVKEKPFVMGDGLKFGFSITNQGIHVHTYVPDYTKCFIIECEIPKGAKYWVELKSVSKFPGYPDMAASKVIMKKLLKTSDKYTIFLPNNRNSFDEKEMTYEEVSKIWDNYKKSK